MFESRSGSYPRVLIIDRLMLAACRVERRRGVFSYLTITFWFFLPLQFLDSDPRLPPSQFFPFDTTTPATLSSRCPSTSTLIPFLHPSSYLTFPHMARLTYGPLVPVTQVVKRSNFRSAFSPPAGLLSGFFAASQRPVLLRFLFSFIPFGEVHLVPSSLFTS